MNDDTFDERIDALQQRLNTLHARAAARGSEPAAVLADALDELATALEELGATRAELRRQNEEQLATAQAVEVQRQRYLDLFERAPDGYIVTGADGCIQEANRVVEQLFHRRREYLIGKPLAVLVAEDERPTFRALLKHLHHDRAERSPRWELRLQPHDAPPFHAAVTVTPICDADGEVSGFRWLVRDVSELKHAEAALQESDARTRAIVETAVDGIVTIDDQGIIRSFNPAAEHLFGYTAAEAIGQPVTLLMPESYRREHAGYIGNYLRTGAKKIIGVGREVHARRKDGSTFPVSLAVSEAFPGGRLMFTGIIHDITERRRTEEALRRERDFAERLVETAQVIVLVLDPEGRIVRFNPYMEEISGYRLREVQGRDWFATFLPPRDHSRIREIFQGAVSDMEVRGNVNPIITKDGREREIEWQGRTLKDRSGTVIGLLSIGQDITERLGAEHRLATQHAVTRVLATSASVTEATPLLLQAICEGLGWDLGELWHAHPGSQRLQCDGMWHTRQLDGSILQPLGEQPTFGRTDGLRGRVWGSGEAVCIADVTDDVDFHRQTIAQQLGLRGACAFPIIGGDDVIGVMDFFSRRTRNLDEDTLRVLQSLGRQIGDFIVRKQAELELRELQRSTQQRERLADIGAITAQIVHELGNPLAGVSMQAQLLLHRAHRDPGQPLSGVLKPIERIFTEVSRLDGLIKEFMEFSREQRLDLKGVHLPRFLRGVVDLWRPVAAARAIVLKVQTPQKVPLLTADEDKLRRVLDNLVKNAIEAIESGPGEVLIHVSLPSADGVRISVIDTGPGIPETVRGFRLFETTKAYGSGIGLAVAKQIVLAHRGTIEFARRDPHGTVFHIELPRRGPLP